MNTLQWSVQKLDRLQQRHHLSAFTYAVIKRYGEDQGAHQAALLTYYAFLALFPLLLVLTTLLQIIAVHQPRLQADIITSVTNTFPVLGDQLSAHVHSLHKTGLALIIGMVFVFYGARGVADVFRSGLSHVWGVPQREQSGFPQSTLQSLLTLVGGGLGIIIASITSGLVAAAGHTWPFRLLWLAVNLVMIYGVLLLLFRINLPRRFPYRELRTGAVAAALGLVALQSLGSYLLARELRSLDALYSYFALALGLIFWIYLQAQIVYYSAEIAVVKHRRLWPRSFSD
jgi:YihY family inner membrane protein